MDMISHLCQLQELAPERVLFEAEGRALSARRLFEQATALSASLRAQGIGPGHNVAVHLPRGMSAVVAIYGILCSGSCYVPLDSSGPSERTAHIVRDCQCRAVIGERQMPQWDLQEDIQTIDLTDLAVQNNSFETVHLSDPEDNAAILYTSGSTGMPKGVVISHRALSAFSHWSQDTFGIRTSDRIANLAPFNFDLSLFDLFSGPCAGATTCIIPDRLKLAPAKLVDWLGQNSITIWYTVPSMLGFITAKGGLHKKSLPDLRQILFAGEVFPTSGLINLSQLLPDTLFFNLFGPTETNVCLFWPVDRDRLVAKQAIPIGRPACGAEARIEPEHGELLIKGPCLMSGYWNNAEPVLPVDDGGWLHTGDKVSINAAGEFEYHGRLDRMIKSAGYRIEPAEIEQILNAVTGVISTAVVAIPDPVSGARIAAAISGADTDMQALRIHANQRLPSYMRPSFYLVMDKMLYLPNGKTDYQRIIQTIESQLS
ncbi:MAG: amino acid adenylation domain-containing protein [Pseudomonadota bacterium]